jgi:UDP-N-acetylmuramoyl-L-alanyl-D-glutamate--2,6-diaminopimelate ligase
VTGTNGKSSVVDFTRQIWTLLGKSAASMGTLGVKVGRSPAEARSPLTTPDPVTLHAELSRLAQEEHVECCALEASSHGLDQHRLDGVHLSAAAFTQLSQDHLDYHQTMAAYFDAKKILFETVLPPSGSCVLNADIPECAALHHIASSCGLQVLTYGQHAQSMVLHSLTPEARGQRFHGTILGKEVDWLIPLLGAFQVENVLCAMGLVLASGTPLEELLSLFPSSKELPIQGVPGRLEMLEKAGKTAIIDYAHTPDALEKALRAVRLHTKGRLFLVFGCGGNRDAEKRPLMGNIAEQRSDKVFLTDDNPREEDPAVIRQQMRAGMTGRVPIREIGDRREAIAAALKEANAEDCVLIAGKGHEKTQCVSGKMLPFSDQEVVQEVLG